MIITLCLGYKVKLEDEVSKQWYLRMFIRRDYLHKTVYKNTSKLEMKHEIMRIEECISKVCTLHEVLSKHATSIKFSIVIFSSAIIMFYTYVI